MTTSITSDRVFNSCNNIHMKIISVMATKMILIDIDLQNHSYYTDDPGNPYLRWEGVFSIYETIFILIQF